MGLEKITIFVVILEAKSKTTNAEEWLIITEDTLIHRGSWFTNVETWLEGFLEALKLANYDVEVKKRWVYDDDLYYTKNLNLEEIAEKLEEKPRSTKKLFGI